MARRNAEKQTLHAHVPYTGKADLPLDARVDTPAVASDRHNEPEAPARGRPSLRLPAPTAMIHQNSPGALEPWSVRLRVGR
jgi:hypothetical protein